MFPTYARNVPNISTKCSQLEQEMSISFYARNVSNVCDKCLQLGLLFTFCWHTSDQLVKRLFNIWRDQHRNINELYPCKTLLDVYTGNWKMVTHFHEVGIFCSREPTPLLLTIDHSKIIDQLSLKCWTCGTEWG